jgi:hypothetical protein
MPSVVYALGFLLVIALGDLADPVGAVPNDR